MKALRLAALLALAACSATPPRAPAAPPPAAREYGIDERFERAERFLHGRSYDAARAEADALDRVLPPEVPRRVELLLLRGRLALLESGCAAAEGPLLDALTLAARVGWRGEPSAVAGLALGRCYRKRGAEGLARQVLERARADAQSEPTRGAIAEELSGLKAD